MMTSASIEQTILITFNTEYKRLYSHFITFFITPTFILLLTKNEMLSLFAYYIDANTATHYTLLLE